MTASRASSVPDYAAAVDYLINLKTRGFALGLERMRRLAAAIGNPQNAVPCVHIAGTNGKGSVAAMLEAILRGAGWRTGLYTSPHLVRLGERVQVDRRVLGEEEIAAYVRELQPVVARLESEFGPDEHPSYFEFMTALAFLHFARSRCDVACLEVGLGGRLDATNIVTPEVSAITSIGFDHCDVLGDTLADIAAEKGGIIKPGVPVVIGRLPREAEEVIREIADAQNARVFSVTEVFGEAVERYPTTNLAGEYQRWNAATATLAARVLAPKWKLSDARIAAALERVDWAGRWQTRAVGGRKVILDTSHNAEGAAVLDANLARLIAETGRRPIIIAGVLGAARARALVPVICRHASEIHFVRPAQSRACTFEEMEALVEPGFAGRVVRNTVEAIFPNAETCTLGQSGDTVVVAGSVYLAGEVLARLEPERGGNEGRLQDF